MFAAAQGLLRRIRSMLASGSEVAAMPIPAESVAQFRPDDQFVVSYPRSGNTWLRHLLRDLIIQQKQGSGFVENPAFPKPRVLLPDLHAHPLDDPSQAEYGMKTRIFKSHNLTDLKGRRMVYFFRSAPDALVSYYHLHVRDPELRPRVEAQGIDQFCRGAAPGWIRHLQVALDYRRQNPDNTLLASYERLLESGVDELGRIARFLGLLSGEENLSSALARNAFEQLHAKEAQNKPKGQEHFYRKGRKGSAREELSEETWKWISARTDVLYQRAIAEAAGR
jgi:hypothetical protein